jgi:thymidine phosphorylase
MKGEAITYDEMFAIIKDISEGKLSEIMMTYYVASSFFYPTTDEEMYQTAKAMAENGITFRYPQGEIVADKHSIGGVPGNETTMILIPIIASLGIKIPKNFSKSITSPAATGECVNVLMDINFTKDGIEKLIEKLNCCLVRGGGLDLAPADDKIIKVQYPLAMQSRAKVVSSIMAKKYAMGITHSLIDIPVGPTAKVSTMEEALDWKKKFEYVGKKL